MQKKKSLTWSAGGEGARLLINQPFSCFPCLWVYSSFFLFRLVILPSAGSLLLCFRLPLWFPLFMFSLSPCVVRLPLFSYSFLFALLCFFVLQSLGSVSSFLSLVLGPSFVLFSLLLFRVLIPSPAFIVGEWHVFFLAMKTPGPLLQEQWWQGRSFLWLGEWKKTSGSFF
jgi:hypothetical protein